MMGLNLCISQEKRKNTSLVPPTVTLFHYQGKLKQRMTLRTGTQRITAPKSRKAKYFETEIPPNFD